MVDSLNTIIPGAPNYSIYNDPLNLVLSETWKLFSIVCGNPLYEYSGVRFLLGILLTLFLINVVKMRAYSSWQMRHFIALAGCCFLLIRFFVMMVFQFGYEIRLYDNQIVRFLFPPMEHCFQMLSYLCIGFYTLASTREDHNPLTSKWHYLVPPLVGVFLVYMCWKWQADFFKVYPNKTLIFADATVHWQAHVVITLLAFHAIVNIIRHVKLTYPLLTIFWLLAFIEHLFTAYYYYYHVATPVITTFLNAFNLLSIPFLTLHFIYGYSRHLRECDNCSWKKRFD